MNIENTIVILHQARTGSHALTEIIASQSGLGWSPELMIPKCDINDVTKNEFISSVKRFMQRYSTCNGIIVKMTYKWWKFRCNNAGIDQCNEVCLLEEIFGQDAKYILLRRKDKIAQAVSLFYALKSGIWTDLDTTEGPKPTMRDYDFNKIKMLLYEIHQHESNWSTIIPYLNFLPLFYEDVFGINSDHWLGCLSSFLGYRITSLETKIFNKRTSISQKIMESEFRRDLSLDESTQGPTCLLQHQSSQLLDTQ